MIVKKVRIEGTAKIPGFNIYPPLETDLNLDEIKRIEKFGFTIIELSEVKTESTVTEVSSDEIKNDEVKTESTVTEVSSDEKVAEENVQNEEETTDDSLSTQEKRIDFKKKK